MRARNENGYDRGGFSVVIRRGWESEFGHRFRLISAEQLL